MQLASSAYLRTCALAGKTTSPYDGKGMMSTAELLASLERSGASRAEIARVLGINPSGVTRLFAGQRSLDLNEAVKLAQEFGLAREPVRPIPLPILRLCVIYVASQLGVEIRGRERRIEELSKDLLAFSEYVSDPKVRERADLAEGFFQGLLHRHLSREEEAPPGTAPAV